MHPDDDDHDRARAPQDAPRVDPGGMKDAHGRTGRLLKNAGLPFEHDEFDDADAPEESVPRDAES